MGLGSTAKKIQAVADRAEDLVNQVGDLRERMLSLEQTVEENNESIQELSREIDEQRVLLEAIAEDQGVETTGTRNEEDQRSQE